MRQFWLPPTLLLLSSLSVMATPCDSLGGNTLDTYIDAGSCDVGNFTFSNWSYIVNASAATLTGSVNNIAADDIVVTPVDGPDGPSFTFTANWGTTSGLVGTGTYAGLLYFRGTAISPGTELLQSNELTVEANVAADSLLGAALASVVEINCVGALLDIGSLPPGCNLPGIGVQAQAGARAGALDLVGTLLGLIDGDLADLIDPLALSASAQLLYPSATDTVDVFKLITVLSTNTLGSPNAAASISSFSQDFTTFEVPPGPQVPEPSTWMLAGMGLLLVAGHRIRLRR
jgi:hypothetical protein